MEHSELLESSTLGTIVPPPTFEDSPEDTQPISKAEIAKAAYDQAVEQANGDLKAIHKAQDVLRRSVGSVMAERIVTHNLAERQFRIIVSGLQLEHYEKVNGLVDVCSDSRFIRAKNELTRIVGQMRASEVLHDIFT